MREVDRRADGLEQLQALRERQAVLVAVAVDRLPLDVLHQEERQAVLRAAAVEQSGDVRVVDVSEDLTFGAESTQDLVGGHPRPDDLCGDPPLELAVGAGGQVDGAHSATPE